MRKKLGDLTASEMQTICNKFPLRCGAECPFYHYDFEDDVVECTLALSPSKWDLETEIY